MRVGLVDVGIANLGSIRRVLDELGVEALVVREGSGVADLDRLILPGVGNYTTAMERLHAGGFVEAIRDFAGKGKPVMGICLGMQLLADAGLEGARLEGAEGEAAITEGLGLIPGTVRSLRELGCVERVPHMGWNSIRFQAETAHASPVAGSLVNEIPEGTDFYFVHSFAFDADQPAHVLATADYGISFPAIIGRGNVFGAQFHPEKSSKLGFQLLRNFLDFRPC